MTLIHCPFCSEQNCLTHHPSSVQCTEGIRLVVIPYLMVLCEKCDTYFGLSLEVYDTDDKIEYLFTPPDDETERHGTLVQ